MDDLEFRRAILADPNAQSDEINAAIAQDPSKKQFAEEIRDFNALIEDAVNIDVPEGLEAKLLKRQPVEKEEPPTTQAESFKKMEAANDNKYWQIAAAACFAFVIGLSINLNMFNQPEIGMGAGEYALKNTYQGMQTVSLRNEQVSLEMLNAKLVSYGVQMEQDIGNVQYANSFFCSFNEMDVMHLVVEGQAGKINLYLLPKGNKLENWNQFSDDRFKGKATRYSKADMVIVGEKGEPLSTFQSKVENSMKWKT